MKNWTWSNQGVDLLDDGLLWYEDVGASAYASGAAAEQSFEEFLERGPSVEGVPAEICNALTQAVREHIAARQTKQDQ